MSKRKDVDKMSYRELRAEINLLREASERAWGHTNHGSMQCSCCQDANNVLGEALINGELVPD